MPLFSEDSYKRSTLTVVRYWGFSVSKELLEGIVVGLGRETGRVV